MYRKRTTHRTVAIMLALFTVPALAAYSTAGPGRPPLGAGGPLMRCIDQLDLAPETRGRVEALIQKQNESMMADRDAMKAAMDTYYTVLTAAQKDSAALSKAQGAIMALEQKRAEKRFALESSIVALLTADEAARLATCLSSAQQEFPGGPPAFGGKSGIR